MKAYSLSTPEGDSFLDYGDSDELLESLSMALGTMRAMSVWQLVMSDEQQAKGYLSRYGVTLTVHNDEDESEDEGDA